MTSMPLNLLTDFVEKKLAAPAEAQSHDTVQDKSLAKGLLAGAIGGLIATAAKTAAERLYPPRTHGEPEPPEVLAEKVAGHALDETTKEASGELIHWTFGIATGAAYGALAEYYPAATGAGRRKLRDDPHGADA